MNESTMTCDLNAIGKRAKDASRILACAGTTQKNEALAAIAEGLIRESEKWLAGNQLDLTAARENGMSEAMLDRLTLTPERIRGIADSVLHVAALPDPVGIVERMETRPNGLIIGKKRVPLGVVAMIFEARPNVAVDSAVLCLKSGNACILRGGKEAIHSNLAAAAIMRNAVKQAGLPEDAITLIEDTTRESSNALMHLNEYVDVLIPRGGRGLIRAVASQASVPVIRTGEGICHIYIDEKADLQLGASVLYNAKCSRPSVCNAVENLLIHEKVADDFLKLAAPLLDEYQVEIRGDRNTCEILGNRAVPATDEDWDTEYDDYILAVKTVSSTDEAIDFIHAHGTGHSEAIITRDYNTAQYFLNAVDAAAVYVNASTRFTDGGEFGLGAEIGISTQKLHARGPMGLQEMTSYKYIIYGEGQVR